ncbi:54S ribosomal protein L31, partial [Penicillium rolfsii]
YNKQGLGARTNCIPDFKHDFARRAITFSLQAAAMFKPTSPLLSGLLWKVPWRLSSPQKARQRKRLRAVDRVVDTLSAALARQGQSTKAVERWYAEMPREEEMLPKDKYTIFDKKEKTYRKGIHKLPKWTRVSQRVNPPGF